MKKRLINLLIILIIKDTNTNHIFPLRGCYIIYITMDTIYIINEDNGMTYEDHVSIDIAYFTDLNKAIKAYNEINTASILSLGKSTLSLKLVSTNIINQQVLIINSKTLKPKEVKNKQYTVVRSFTHFEYLDIEATSETEAIELAKQSEDEEWETNPNNQEEWIYGISY